MRLCKWLAPWRSAPPDLQTELQELFQSVDGVSIAVSKLASFAEKFGDSHAFPFIADNNVSSFDDRHR